MRALTLHQPADLKIGSSGSDFNKWSYCHGNYCHAKYVFQIKDRHCNNFAKGLMYTFNTVNREIFAALKVGEFTFFQLAIDKILRLLQKLNG
jgi:hypothetical protein